MKEVGFSGAVGSHDNVNARAEGLGYAGLLIALEST
jgi:hypothetical protein